MTRRGIKSMTSVKGTSSKIMIRNLKCVINLNKNKYTFTIVVSSSSSIAFVGHAEVCTQCVGTSKSNLNSNVF